MGSWVAGRAPQASSKVAEGQRFSGEGTPATHELLLEVFQIGFSSPHRNGQHLDAFAG